MTVLAVLMMVVTTVMSDVQKSWRQANSKVSEFREARRAFDRMVNSVSQAELNAYLCYRYAGSTDPLTPPSKTLKDQPSGYVRYSELQFVCGPSSLNGAVKLTGLSDSLSPGHAVFFQAPMGTSNQYRLPTALNGCGFYVRFGDDAAYRPPFLNGLSKNPVNRYRLFEFRTPAEDNTGYDTNQPWYQEFASWSRPIANNIILLIISPQLSNSDATGAGGLPTSIAPNYIYDSRPAGGVSSGDQTQQEYQLPPMVAVTMVAIDEATASNLELDSGANPPLAAELDSGNLFKNANSYQADLEKLEGNLVAKRVNFRVFTATIPIRASKWGKGTNS